MELLLLLLPLRLLPWFGPKRRAGRTVGRAGGAAGFAFGGNGAQKLSKACSTFFESPWPQLKGPRNKAWIVSPCPQLKGPRNKARIQRLSRFPQ